MPAKICFITAIYGRYEATCKPFEPQTVEADFICFTDAQDIEANGWTIDNTPYHTTHPSPLDTGKTRNSLKFNKHTFNVAKYYKQAFLNIPRLQSYEIIVWLDGTIRIDSPTVAEWLLNHQALIITWNHEGRDGKYTSEAHVSDYDARYNSRFWANQSQPLQPCGRQADMYQAEGFAPDALKRPENPCHGLWVTCFVSFRHTLPEVQNFLNSWYQQTLIHTTQDQIGFPYAVWKTGIYPLTLPNEEIAGEKPHFKTDFYTKLEHGK
jgi:hypothetical protein